MAGGKIPIYTPHSCPKKLSIIRYHFYNSLLYINYLSTFLEKKYYFVFENFTKYLFSYFFINQIQKIN